VLLLSNVYGLVGCSDYEFVLLSLVDHILIGFLGVRTRCSLWLLVTLVVIRLNVSLSFISIVTFAHLIVIVIALSSKDPRVQSTVPLITGSCCLLRIPDLLDLRAADLLFQAVQFLAHVRCFPDSFDEDAAAICGLPLNVTTLTEAETDVN